MRQVTQLPRKCDTCDLSAHWTNEQLTLAAEVIRPQEGDCSSTAGQPRFVRDAPSSLQTPSRGIGAGNRLPCSQLTSWLIMVWSTKASSVALTPCAAAGCKCLVAIVLCGCHVPGRECEDLLGTAPMPALSKAF